MVKFISLVPCNIIDDDIGDRSMFKMGGSLTTPTAPQMTDVNPNRCGEPMNRSEEKPSPFRAGRRSATIGGVANLIYGIAQGLASEVGYVLFRYKRFDALTAFIAGALAGFPAVSLDAVLFSEIASPEVMLLWYVAAVISGGFYGLVAYTATSRVRRY